MDLDFVFVFAFGGKKKKKKKKNNNQMSRGKQTARKTGGGMAPRKKLATTYVVPPNPILPSLNFDVRILGGTVESYDNYDQEFEDIKPDHLKCRICNLQLNVEESLKRATDEFREIFVPYISDSMGLPDGREKHIGLCQYCISHIDYDVRQEKKRILDEIKFGNLSSIKSVKETENNISGKKRKREEDSNDEEKEKKKRRVN